MEWKPGGKAREPARKNKSSMALFVALSDLLQKRTLFYRLTTTLASTTLKSAPNERHFFAIYISYYVKVRLVVSGVGGDVSIKIP